jgi:hypothetical protein
MRSRSASETQTAPLSSTIPEFLAYSRTLAHKLSGNRTPTRRMGQGSRMNTTVSTNSDTGRALIPL